MKCVVFLCFVMGVALASEFRFSDEMYHEAMRDIQSQKMTSNDASIEWACCMDLMSSTDMQKRQEGRQLLIALIKRMNILATEADLLDMLSFHENAIKGQHDACLKLAIALIKGEWGFLIFPCNPEMALPYLEKLTVE